MPRSYQLKQGCDERIHTILKHLIDISHLLADACILTVCDCKKGYWHQMLDEAYSYLTMFNTKIGRYRFTVMPFGITVTRDVFQWKLDECFGHIKNLIVIADNIMVIGKHHNHKDHDFAFTKLLQTARRCNVKLNYDKLRFKCTEVDFYGKTYTTDGCQPAQNKITAIIEMPPPSSKREVQSFIRMINYLTKFLPRLTELSEPIRELIKEKVPFNWGPRVPRIICHAEERTSEGTSSCVLQSLKGDHTASRCQHQGPRGLPITREKSFLLHQQSPNWDAEEIHGHRNWISCCSMGSRKIPPLSLWMSTSYLRWTKNHLKQYSLEVSTMQLHDYNAFWSEPYHIISQ